MEAIERSLSSEDDCADVLMLLANVRGGFNSLMDEVLEDHIRLHIPTPKKSAIPHVELAEDLIDLVRASPLTIFREGVNFPVAGAIVENTKLDCIRRSLLNAWVAAACHYGTVNLRTLVIGPVDSVLVLVIG